VSRPVRRLQVVTATFVVAFAGLVVRAAQVQIVEGAEHAAASATSRTERRDLPARRGTIFDRRGVVLAEDQQMYSVDVAPNELRDREAAALELSRRLDVPLATVRRKLRERWTVFGVYSSAVTQPLRSVRGVHLADVWRRRYPLGRLARGIVGSPIAASGIEAVLDSALTGRAGEAVVLRDRTGQRYDSPSRLGSLPVAGRDVFLTIDADLQEIAERAIGDAVTQYRAEGGDVVVVEPHTGEILAFAWHGPTTASAVTAPFEPGSTAKLFAAAALLTHGLVEPDDSVWTEQGRFDMEYRTVTDHEPEGWLTLRGVIQRSSNIGMVKFADRLTPAQQYTMLRDFGLGTPTALDFPADAAGNLPRPDTWSGTTAASLAMGYELSVTTLQLAMAYAAVANGGILLQPALVREVRDPGGRTVHRHEPRPVRRVVSTAVADTLRDMLRSVVYEGGTGEAAALYSHEVAGKTGTARVAEAGRYAMDKHRTSFVSIFPAEDPQLVMVVKLDNPAGVYASATAAPVTRRILLQLLASRTGLLDRSRLPAERADEAIESDAAPRAEPWVTAWPVDSAEVAPPMVPVPDVSGRDLREAARLLHGAGFRVHVEGWGRVQRTTPAAGRAAQVGTLVTVRASERSR
jgi:cell division protein FtsI (penicillin-binding protein 3)